MNAFKSELDQELDSLRREGLYRELRRVDSPQQARIELNGKTLLNFSSNDYLGLANHPALKQAALGALERYGAGAGASRLICGSLAPHHQLEEALANFEASPAALAFTTGYCAALGAICALTGPQDIVILDKLVHASIVDGARLSRAKLRVFRHNDLNHLEELLRWAAERNGGQSNARRPRVLVITESVFSMDGDQAPLRQIVELKERFGARLMVDEAHATGLFGANRRGLAEELGVAGQIEIRMGTLGKALGAAGGFICGSRSLIDYLINRARPFIFSTAPVPAAAAAAAAGVSLAQSDLGEQRRLMVWQLVTALATRLNLAESPRSAIIPLQIGDESRAVATAAALRERGIFIPAIRYPTVARGRARLRLTLTANHVSSDLEQLAAALAEISSKSAEFF